VLPAGGPHGYVERLLREAGRDVPRSGRILEVNADHAVIQRLNALLQGGDPRVDDWIEILHDQALVTEGAPLEDPNAFARRITALLASSGPGVSGAAVPPA
jgi:molecular chaperone HtpG